MTWSDAARAAAVAARRKGSKAVGSVKSGAGKIGTAVKSRTFRKTVDGTVVGAYGGWATSGFRGSGALAGAIAGGRAAYKHEKAHPGEDVRWVVGNPKKAAVGYNPHYAKALAHGAAAGLGVRAGVALGKSAGKSISRNKFANKRGLPEHAGTTINTNKKGKSVSYSVSGGRTRKMKSK